MRKLILSALFSCLIFGQAVSQLPSAQPDDKLTISFHTNVEFLGFLYFLAYEGVNSETKTVEINGREILEKDWQTYGYAFYQKYSRFTQSPHLQTAMGLAEHLWLDDLWPLLLQVPDFPRATLPSTIEETYYLAFSKSKKPEEARKNAAEFLSACNAMYAEVNFDQYMRESAVYYQSALQQIQASLPSSQFISVMEAFYRKTFPQYVLIPSLTLPKGMGFGPRVRINGEMRVYNIFGAVDFQSISDTKQLDMGFGQKDRLRELSIHEFGHSFVNPEIYRLAADQIEATASLFAPLRSAMENQGYNDWKSCLIEHFVRAGEVVIAEKMGDAEAVRRLNEEYLNHRKFVYLPIIREELIRYDADTTDSYAWVVDRVLYRLGNEVRHVPQTKPTDGFTNNPSEAKFHTDDITTFWQVFDQHSPKLPGEVLQKEYLDKGSPGLKGFIRNRIESGKYLSKTVRSQLGYYTYVRPFTLSIAQKKERLYECFLNLKKLYPAAVFPDVYFVIGANNTGGTTFSQGLIIGAERFGKTTDTYQPALDIDEVDEVVAHELVHFQQKYAKDNSLLAQCIREGAADFICELIAGSHTNQETYQYGHAHQAELWQEFQAKMYHNDWSEWLYYTKNKSRPKDLGYWMGYQICKAYYNRTTDKTQAISDILNIDDFRKFLEASGYTGN
jgi:hypothetical protein